jgi:hypothetical protein
LPSVWSVNCREVSAGLTAGWVGRPATGFSPVFGTPGVLGEMRGPIVAARLRLRLPGT